MNGITWIRIGAIFAAGAVAAGAFGAHALRERLDARSLEIFETAARYQMYHALAIIAVGAIEAAAGARGSIRLAGWAFSLGIVIFSGSLYALSVTGIKKLGMITPIGGLLFIVGWLALAAIAVPKSINT
jgi:uncharacterized membrane protein YgdD (TMEM256/DUF423 family)